MADEIDNELATELRKALKQPRNFALIARGVEPLKLFVQKKPLKLSELKTAKSELGGKQIKLGDRASTIIGVLEPSVPYPAETELMANVVTSSHHMSATMQDGRVHRMTELFGRLSPGASIEQARAELQATHGAIVTEHREAYPASDNFGIMAVPLRDQITSNARTVLLVLLAASGLIFVIACSNVANLILARSVRREGELAIRAALGATTGALRRTLLAESLLLCGAGALLGVLATGYLGVWALFGLAAFVADGALHGLVARAPAVAARVDLWPAALLVAAGLFQVSPLKSACPFNVAIGSPSTSMRTRSTSGKFAASVPSRQRTVASSASEPPG